MNFATTIFGVFASCVRAIRDGKLILRQSSKDKEFHFQNWFKERLAESGFNYGDTDSRRTKELVIACSFDLQTNELLPRKVPNPTAGREHQFRAWRLKGEPADLVSMRDFDLEDLDLEPDDEGAQE